MRNRAVTRAFTAMILTLPWVAGCGSSTVWQGDPQLYGAKLEVADQSEWTQRPDFTDRVRHVIEMSAARWGIDPQELSGWRILFKARGAGGIDCQGSAGPHHDGCTDELERTITIAVDGWYCVEETPLAHEIGHVALLATAGGDPGHGDPRWWNDAEWRVLWDDLAEQLPSPDGSVARCFVKGSYPLVERWTGLGN